MQDFQGLDAERYGVAVSHHQATRNASRGRLPRMPHRPTPLASIHIVFDASRCCPSMASMWPPKSCLAFVTGVRDPCIATGLLLVSNSRLTLGGDSPSATTCAGVIPGY